MRALEYAFRQGWTSLWRSRGATMFAVAAIALAVVVLGALLVVTWNARRAVARLGSAAEFSIYFADEATSEQRGAIEAAVDGSGVASAHEYVSRQQALERFRAQFADLAAVTADLGDNPFPASLEVRLRPDVDVDARADALVRQVAAMPGVSDVRYDRDWLRSVTGLLRTVNVAGLVLVLIMSVAAAVTVGAVVRLGLYARRDEIEIMELVGAPMAFIRGPFVAEGLLQGGLGAAVALLALWAGFLAARAWWGAPLAAALDGQTFEFLPLGFTALLLGGGMLLGSLGGLAAARHALAADTGR